MTQHQASSSFWRFVPVEPYTLYRMFKYAVYLLLAWNVVLFFKDDYLASAEIFGDAITLSNVVEAYSATIDTLAWVILLLLFELETAVISDDMLEGKLTWLFVGTRSICYFFIVYAFYGYIAKYVLLSHNIPLLLDDVCSLKGTDFTYIAQLDEYLPIDAIACQTMQGQALFQVSGTQIIGTGVALQDAIYLAIVDIVNAGDWLIIVVFLEFEVFLQLRNALTTRILTVAKMVKGILYPVLFAAAIYWGFEGDFLDFWDAFLWLVAFIFIEMNIFEWHGETKGSGL